MAEVSVNINPDWYSGKRGHEILQESLTFLGVIYTEPSSHEIGRYHFTLSNPVAKRLKQKLEEKAGVYVSVEEKPVPENFLLL